MSETTTLARVTDMLTDVLGVDEARVTTDARLIDDLGADSLDLVEIEIEAEDRFGVTVEDPSPLTMESTVGDLVRIIDERTAG